MTSVTPLLFPVFGNLLAAYLVVHRKFHAIRTLLIVNLVVSVLFGLFIAVKVFCCSADPSLWPMPLIFAPVEYWAKFGILIVILTAALVVWSKKTASREQS
jgi:protein-S-isoprenylcysteine O-methyltransferase Ste14